MGTRQIPSESEGTVSRRKTLALLGAGIAASAGAAIVREPAMAQDATPVESPAVPEDFKVVLHAGQEQNWPYVLSNLKNLTAEWPKAQIRVVVDGSAVYTLQGSSDQLTELAAAAASGVVVHVCPNALKEHQIDPANVPPYALTNLGGVVALVQAQLAGFVYVKP
jgi:intracellular sulfur oxidation DsrE/DsrF family protein